MPKLSGSLEEEISKTKDERRSLFKHLHRRQIVAGESSLCSSIVSEVTTRSIPLVLREHDISLGRSDKVFASKWLDDRKVVCGTKCNQLLVLDVVSGQKVAIPMLEGSPHSVLPEKNCGIHSIAINSSRTLLATSGKNPNDLAVYRLPTFDPLFVGESHNDWVFSTTWIDDKCAVTGSRDGTISLWNVENFLFTSDPTISPPFVRPTSTLVGNITPDRIRDVSYNTYTKQLAALSPNAYVHLWDVETCKQSCTVELPFCQENVCLALEKECSLYAVGSQSHICFLDSRTTKPVGSICSKDEGAGVRSISFRDLLVTVGTGYGSVFFFDIKAGKFLEDRAGKIHSLKTGRGWLKIDDNSVDFMLDRNAECCRNAVYTHCYGKNGTKLFTAGGPLALVLRGNYAALWE